MSKIEVNEISKTSTANQVTFTSPVIVNDTMTINDTVIMQSGLKMKSYQTSELAALTPSAGEVIYDTDVQKLKVYTGSSWDEVGTTVDLSNYATLDDSFAYQMIIGD